MTDSTLVIQSHRQPLPRRWLKTCIKSVRQWAAQHGFDYRFVGDDQLFASVPDDLLKKTENRKVIATDLARLRVLQAGLKEGYQRVVWCDADFLIFNPDEFCLPDADYALGREVWIQQHGENDLKVYTKVHNAFLMFAAANHFLDFYADSAERLLRLNRGGMPPQFIGPKLLTALHNIVQCPVLETAGMLSPPVMRDVIEGGGRALDLFLDKSAAEICAANLSGSLTDREGFSEVRMARLIDCLMEAGVFKRS